MSPSRRCLPVLVLVLVLLLDCAGHAPALAAVGCKKLRLGANWSPKQMGIRYSSSQKINSSQFIDLLQRSTLGERRPIHNLKTIRAMLRYGNLLCTAWDGKKLVGIARSVTDFQFCCYLSDLAVDVAYQKQGIGRALISLTESRLGPDAFIILLAAPKAVSYYPKLGFDPHPSAWELPGGRKVK